MSLREWKRQSRGREEGGGGGIGRTVEKRKRSEKKRINEENRKEVNRIEKK